MMSRDSSAWAKLDFLYLLYWILLHVCSFDGHFHSWTRCISTSSRLPKFYNSVKSSRHCSGFVALPKCYQYMYCSRDKPWLRNGDTNPRNEIKMSLSCDWTITCKVPLGSPKHMELGTSLLLHLEDKCLMICLPSMVHLCTYIMLMPRTSPTGQE